MTTHRHLDSRSKWTSSVTDPDLSGFASKVALAALEARIAALEAVPKPPPAPAWVNRAFFAA